MQPPHPGASALVQRLPSALACPSSKNGTHSTPNRYDMSFRVFGGGVLVGYDVLLELLHQHHRT